MGVFRIGATQVIDENKKLENIADGSGELSLSGDTLTLTIGGTVQDTQSLQSVTVNEALKLTNSRTIALAGDVTGSASFDGSGNTEISTVYANIGSLFSSGLTVTNETYRFQEAAGTHYSDLGVAEADGVCFLTKWYGSCPSISDGDNCGCWTEISGGTWRLASNGGDGNENDMGCGARCLTW